MANKDNYTILQLENLGNRIKEIRRQKGYANYEQFAFDNELPRAQYGRYEKEQDLTQLAQVTVLRKKSSFFIVLIINHIQNFVKIFSYSVICNTLIINYSIFESAL